MEIVLQEDKKYILKFEKGEEFIETMKDFCTKQKINAAAFSAIGATDDCTLSYYGFGDNKYEDHDYSGGNFEVINITGNISRFEDEIKVHAHGIISGADMHPIAGHVKKLVVSVTCEVYLQTFAGTIERAPVAGTELFLMK